MNQSEGLRKKLYPGLMMWLMNNGYSVKWLSDTTGIPYNSLMDKLKESKGGKPKSPMREADLEAITEATGLTEQEMKGGIS